VVTVRFSLESLFSSYNQIGSAKFIWRWMCLRNLIPAVGSLWDIADGLRTVIRDPNDSRFDLEAYLKVVDAESQ
jgi:hypothetical protein